MALLLASVSGAAVAQAYVIRSVDFQVKGRTKEFVLMAIIDPNREIPGSSFPDKVSLDVFVADRTRLLSSQRVLAAVTPSYEAIAAADGGWDVVVHNAGITRDASLQKMTAENWQQVLDVNLTGVFNCTKAISAFMIDHGGGAIINTSSIVGLYGNYGQSNYAATKSGVIGLTKTWARELGKYNITVNAVAPGFIATDMIATIPTKVIEAMKEKVPLKKLGTPDDVANVYAFLASKEATFISGAVISVDGGLTI